MRISVGSLLAGEHLPYKIGDVQVKLDGKLVPRAFDADDEEGWVHHYLTDADGKLIPDRYTNEAQVVCSYGKVEFIFHKEIE